MVDFLHLLYVCAFLNIGKGQVFGLCPPPPSTGVHAAGQVLPFHDRLRKSAIHMIAY
jgi:hypothetical protein